tara:strand:+ start:4167 stop:4694 length:528 start_codon:yes stop_codon:yes gene_type:complete
MGTIESTIVVDMAFYVLSIIVLAGAIGVVTTKSVFRAGIMLIASFLGAAGLFILLRAEFIGVVQILIYVGAISVLLLFGTLMTRDVEYASLTNNKKIPGIAICGVLLAVFIFVILTSKLDIQIISGTGGDDSYVNAIPYLAELLMNEFVIVFEIVSVLLLSAIIGGLMLVRENKS